MWPGVLRSRVIQPLDAGMNGLPKGTDTALAAAGFGNLADDSWVMLDELKTWAAADKHSQAFTALKNERSQRMGQRCAR